MLKKLILIHFKVLFFSVIIFLCTIQISKSQTTLSIAITNNSGSSTICLGTSLTFAATLDKAGTCSFTYQWFKNGNAISNATSSTFSFNSFVNGDKIKAQALTTDTCNQPESNEITLTVNTNATISLIAGNGSQTVCNGTAINNIEYTVGGGGANATVAGLPAGVSGSFSNGKYTISGTPTASGLFSYTVTTTGNCNQTTATGSINVNPIPAMTSAISTSICSGSALSFALTSDISSSFSWVATDNVNITGESTSAQTGNTINNLLVNSTTNSQNVSYTLTPTANNTGCIGSGQVLTVTVNPKITLKLTNEGSTSVTKFNGISFFIQCTPFNSDDIALSNSTAASDRSKVSSYTFEWGDGSIDAPIATFTTNQVHLYNTGFYTLKVTLKTLEGCKYDNNYSVFIGSSPKGNLGNPGNLAGCGPLSFTFPITGTTGNVPGTQYVVRFGDGDSVIYIHPNVPASVFHTYIKTSCGSTATLGGTTYQNSFQASMTAINPCYPPAVTPVGPIIINSAPIAKIKTSSNAVCLNQLDTLINISIPGGIVSETGCSSKSSKYWTISSPTGWTSSSNFGATSRPDIPNNINYWSNGDSIINISFTQAGSYTFNFYNGNGCGNTSSSSTIIVYPPPLVTAIPAQSICSGAFTTSSNFVSSVPNTTYSWSAVGTTGITGFSSSGNGNIPSTLFTNTGNTVDTVIYTITPSANGCSGTSITDTIYVKPIPKVTNTPLTQSVCSGTNTSNVNLTSNVSGATFIWNAIATTGISGFTTSGTNTIPSQTLSTTHFINGTVTYSIAVTANGCAGPSSDYIITVKPTPQVTNNPLAQTICSGKKNTTIFLTSDVTGTTFAWSATATTGISGFASSGTISIPAQTITTTNVSAGSITYVITPTANGCTGSTANYIININPTPAIPTASNNTPVCSGSSLNLTASPTLTGVIYAWTSTNGFTSLLQNPIISNLTTANAGTYSVIATATLGNCASNAGSTIVTVNLTPAAPTATTTITYCQNATPIALASNAGSGNTLYWYTIAISGTGSTTVPMPSTINAGTTTYYVSQRTTQGCESAKTTITVTVNPTPEAPVVTTPVTYCQGESSLDLIATADGRNSLKWYTVASSGSSNTTAPKPSTTTFGTTIYYVSQTTALSCESPRSAISVVVNPTPFIPAQTAVICSGSNFSVTPVNGSTNVSTAVPTSTTYSWSAPTVTGGLTGGLAAANQTSISGTLNNPTSQVQTATYSVTPKSGVTGNCIGNSFTVTVTVNPTPSVTKPTDQAVCTGTSTTKVSFSGNGTSYPWTNSNIAIGLATPSIGDINAFTGTNTTNAAISGMITITPRFTGNAVVCDGQQQTFIITINPKPVIPDQKVSICSNSNFTSNPSNNGGNTIVPTGTTFTWSNPVSSPVGAITGGSAQNFGQTAISQILINNTTTNATLTYTVTPTSGSCLGATFKVEVTVNPQPGISDQNLAICSGTAFNATPSGTPANTTYTRVNDPVSNPIGAITGGTKQITAITTIGQILTNITTAPAVLTYTVTPSSGGCGNGTFTVIVTVNPKPIVTKQTTAICSGTTFNVIPTNVPSGTTYTWASSPVISPSNSITGGTSQSNGQTSISQTLTNTTNASATATYSVIPTSGAGGSCVGSAFDIVVTVNPQPIIPSYTLTSCSGAAFTSSPTNGNGNIVPSSTTYTWALPTVPSELTGAATGTNLTSIGGTVTNTSNSSKTATYIVTPTSGASGNCVGTDFTVTVTVNSKPAISNQTITVCTGEAISFSALYGNPTAATIVPLGTTYSWASPTLPSGLTGATAGSGANSFTNTLTNTTNTPKAATFTVTPKTSTCDGATFTITVTINPKPKVPSQTAVVCSGSPFILTLTEASPTTIIPANTIYTWSAPTGSVTGGLSGTGQSSVSGTLTNAGANPTNAIYNITPKSGAAGSCYGEIFTYTVTVNIIPNISSSGSDGPSTCGGSDGKITLNGLVSGVSYTVSYTFNSGTPKTLGTAIVANGSGQVIIKGLFSGNYTNIYVTVNGCPSNPIADISLSDPTLPATPIAQSNTPVCSGQTLNLSVNSSESGGIYTWSGPLLTATTTTTGSLPINNPSTGSSGTYNVTVVVAGCTSLVGSTSVIVNQTPALPIVVTPVTYCEGITANALSATALSGNTLNWWGTNQTGGTAGTSIPTPLTSIVGNVTYYVSQIVTATSCESARTPIVVTTNITPAEPTVTSTITYCQGVTASALTATVSASTTNILRWWGTAATNGTFTTIAPIPSTSMVGTTTYYISQITSLGCEGPRTAIKVTVNETPAAPVASSTISYCQNATATALTATTLSDNTLKWYSVAQNGTAIPTPTPSTTTAGVTSYYVSQTTALACESVRTKIDVRINVTPSVPMVTTPVTYCEGNTPIALIATASGSNTLNWWGNDATGGTKSVMPTTPTTIIAGKISYYVSQTTPISFCEGPRSKIEVLVKPTPVIVAITKTNPINCASSTGTITLSGLIKDSSYTINYSKDGITQNALTIIANANGDVVIEGLRAGVYSNFSLILRGCPSTVIAGSEVLVDPTPPSTPKATSNEPICSGKDLKLFATTTTTGSGITYNWSCIPNRFSSTDQNPVIANATTLVSGTYSVKATLNSCESEAGTVLVVVDSTPAKPIISSNTPLCFGSNLNLTSTTTFAGAPNSLTYSWSGPNSFTSSVQNPTILGASELASGKYILKITANTSTCFSDTASMLVLVRPLLTQAVISGSDSVFVCGYATTNATQTLIANLNASRLYETGKWIIINQPIGSNASFENSTVASTTFTYDKSGFYKLEWAINNDINCPTTKDTLVLSIIDKPRITQNLTASTINVCSGNPVSISLPNSVIIGNISYWQFKRPYNASLWTDTLITSPIITFNNVQDTFKVRLAVIAIDQIHCSGDTAFQEILINVAPKSLPGVSSGVNTVCKGSNTGTIVLAGNIGSPIWQLSYDGLNFSNTAIIRQTYTYTNLLKTTWFRAAVKSGACDTVFSNATKITVFPPVTPAYAGLDAELCGDTTYSLSGNALSSTETGLWSFAYGSPIATINTPTNPNTVISKLVANTTYQLIWTISNGICPSTQNLVIVKNYLPLTNNIDTATLTICNSVILTVTGYSPVGGNTPYLYQWQVLKGGNWVNVVGANSISYTFTADTTVKIRRLVTALPCTNASLEKIIYVQPPLGNNTINGNVQTCINTSPGLLIGSLPIGADGNYIYQWQISSSANDSWTNISGATNKDYPAPVLIVTTYYRRLVTSALCSGNQGLFSVDFEVIVRPDAVAQWAITKDTACAPFNINNAIVNSKIKPLQNSNYSWYANNVLYGNSATINPGYILQSPGDSVVIKMVASSLYGCKNDSLEHKFFTIPKLLTAFVVSDTAGCGPLLVKFTNITPNIGFFIYSWNFGNNITSKIPNPDSVSFAPNPNFTDTTYRVVLTAKGECETVSAHKNITVKSKPKSIFTPNKTIGCSPLAVGFTNISKGLGVTYLWDFGDGSVLAASTQQQVSHVFSTGVQDTFKVKLIAINQCGNDTSIYRIVVSPNKIKLDFAVNGNQKQVCKPGNISFINSTSGATNFQWNFGDGNVLSTSKNLDTVLHTYLQYGNYNVTLTATNGCSDTTSTELIKVFNSPSANFAATPITACLGDTIYFTNQSDTITSLLWNFKDGYTSTVVNPVHAYKTPGVYNVVLKAIRQYNSGLACTDTIVKPITIVSKLTGAYKVSDSISTCVPFTVTFTNFSLPSALTTWQLDNGKKDTGNIITHTFTKIGDFIVNMLATNPGGCQYEVIKTIKVNGPEGTFKYDTGFVCGSTPVRFQVFATGTDSVRWNFGDGIIQTTSSKIVYHIFQSVGTFLPTATLLTNSFKSCSVLLNGLDTIKVDYVTAGFAFTENKVCGLTTVQFIDTSRHFYPLSSWQWNLGDATTSNLTNTSKSYSTTNTWLIDLIVKSQSGCVSTVSKNLFVKVNNFPLAQIVTLPLVCTHKIINYVANVTSNDSVNLYSWQFSNGVNLNGKSVNNFYTTAGTYTAKLLVRTIYGCADSTTLTQTLKPTPTVVASVDQLICRGKSVPLTVTGASNYSWVPLNSSLSCYACASPIAAPTTTTNYIVTGYSAAGCANDDTVLITVAQPIKLSLSTNDTICIGQSSQLFVRGATTYIWSPSIGLDKSTIVTPIATPTLTTKYQVIGFDNYNCFQDTATVVVAVGQYPTIQLGADKVFATGSLLPLSYTSTNGPLTTFLWTPSTNLSCNNCTLPIATVKKDVCYTVVAANEYKCAATDTLCIKVFCENTQVFIPNVFTPDNDGINDVLMVRGTGIKTVKSFRIFNRWGQIVFERGNITPNNASQGWNGKINGTPASPDVYVYTCEVVCENDVTFTYKGNVAIIK